MATGHPFLPRSLQTGTKRVKVSQPRTLPPDAPQNLQPSHKAETWPDDDLVLLYELCLSDYAIWSDSALLEAMKANDGYVSLRILDGSNYFASATRPDDTQVAKALRAASNKLEVRVLITQPDRNNWFGRGDAADTGGFELRRKDWPQVTHSLAARTQDYWNERTIYIENLPLDTRTPVSIARRIAELVESDACVQNVEFPAHVQAAADEVPRCRGFAFVTLDTSAHARAALAMAPWDAQAGVRTLSLVRWEVLKEEYLSRQRALVLPSIATPSTVVESVAPADNDTVVAEVDAQHDDDFPRNRLVLLHNIPLAATKSSVKTMLTQALDGDTGIDYVDFVKNVDRCHVRLASTEHARQLVAYFDGTSNGGVRAQLLQGEQETIYWGKVPEKLRRAAMGLNVSIAEPVRLRKRQRKG